MSEGKVRIPNEENNWGLPDGSHVTIPGGLYTKKRLTKTVNAALKEAKKPYRFNKAGDIIQISPAEDAPEAIEVDLSSMAAQLPAPLQFWCGICAILSFCEKEQDTAGWLVGKRMYQKFYTECKPEGWPPTFKDFVTVNFPEFKIPATVRSGIVLAGPGELSKIRAAQYKLEGERR